MKKITVYYETNLGKQEKSFKGKTAESKCNQFLRQLMKNHIQLVNEIEDYNLRYKTSDTEVPVFTEIPNLKVEIKTVNCD